MRRLPDQHRGRFKDPFGSLHRDIDEVIPLLKGRLVCSVGDVVTANLLNRGITPDIAIIDGQTMRSPCPRTPLLPAPRYRISNPAGTITGDLLEAISLAVSSPPALIFVDGEEDLAVIPLVIEVPDGAAVLYGQPGEGVVLRIVDDEARSKALDLFSMFVNED
jgi:uncharacterized protein (UPF0218 family)